MHSQRSEEKSRKRDKHQSGESCAKYERVPWMLALQNETVTETNTAIETPSLIQ